MIEQRKELCDIKCQHAHGKVFDPSWSNKMSESDAHISSGFIFV